MPNRFPGVDPYLESQGFWPDFHARFVNYWCEVLAAKLPENYEARIDERVNLVELPPKAIQRIKRIRRITRSWRSRDLVNFTNANYSEARS